MRRCTATLMTLAALGLVAFCAAPARAAPNVEIVVNNSLYAGGEITASLNQYMQNITNQGYNPILTTTNFADAAALRNHLANRRSTQGLAGAVFVGELPAAQFEIAAHAGWSYEAFAADYYYQDLDGVWADTNANNILDSFTGNVAPEIWFGRLSTAPLVNLHSGRTEAGMLNDYFARNNAYRTGQLRVSTNGLAFIDDDWAGFAANWSSGLSQAVSGNVTVVSNFATTNATNLATQLNSGYEHVLLAAHSNAALHKFKPMAGDVWQGGTVNNTDVAGMDPNVLFYNLFACNVGDFTTEGYIGGEYVFGTDTGLIGVETTKIGSMLEFEHYFTPLGDGESFGEAMQAWWTSVSDLGYLTQNDQDWYLGMTLLGDPLLHTQAYMPEPTSLAILAAGAMLLRRRRRT